MKVLVIGANGNTATRVVRRLAASCHEPLAMIRNAEQRHKFDEMAVPTVLADLEYPIDHAVQGCDAVIFAAGSGGRTGKDKTVLVDHIGAIRSMVTAQLHGARRFVMLSSTNADVNSQSRIAHYHTAKGLMRPSPLLCQRPLRFASTPNLPRSSMKKEAESLALIQPCSPALPQNTNWRSISSRSRTLTSFGIPLAGASVTLPLPALPCYRSAIWVKPAVGASPT